MAWNVIGFGQLNVKQTNKNQRGRKREERNMETGKASGEHEGNQRKETTSKRNEDEQGNRM
jgi:hypothetical protein